MDAYKVALDRLRKLNRNQYGKVKDFAPNNPELFIQIVKGLIRAGYCEYEFSDDYTAVKRLDLPDHATDYFDELKVKFTKSLK